MAKEGYKRKLTAIFSADVEGYSRLMGENEVATVETLKQYREGIFNFIARHLGLAMASISPLAWKNWQREEGCASPGRLMIRLITNLRSDLSTWENNR